MKNEIKEWIRSIGIALLLGIIITSFIRGTRVYGSSMSPTLNQGDILVMFNSKKIIKGDIVIIDTDLEIKPEDLRGLNPISKLKIGKTKKLVKRVIATEGDNLVIKNGKVFLNGHELKENYINSKETFGDLRIERVPVDKLFVMGDNRENSLDSRDRRVSLVDVDDVMGKAILRLYPFSKLGVIK